MAPVDAIVARARGCIGVRFRLHGRDPATGLDCAGVVAVAYGLERIPTGYALRGGEAAAIIASAAAHGFQRAEIVRAGSLLVMRAGPYQHHLGVATGTGFVHADARLRRVVETPGEPAWSLIAALYFEGD